jgi:hypothetical protein
MHEHPGSSDLVLGDSAIGLGEMPHDLKKRTQVLLWQIFESRSGDIGAETRETIGKTTIELVAEQQADERHPGTPCGQTAQYANDLTPVRHNSVPGMNSLAPSCNANRRRNLFPSLLLATLTSNRHHPLQYDSQRYA